MTSFKLDVAPERLWSEGEYPSALHENALHFIEALHHQVWGREARNSRCRAVFHRSNSVTAETRRVVWCFRSQAKRHAVDISDQPQRTWEVVVTQAAQAVISPHENQRVNVVGRQRFTDTVRCRGSKFAEAGCGWGGGLPGDGSQGAGQLSRRLRRHGGPQARYVRPFQADGSGRYRNAFASRQKTAKSDCWAPSSKGSWSLRDERPLSHVQPSVPQ